MIMKHSIILCALAAAICANAQTATRLTASKDNDFGIVYTLPVTALDITVETELSELTPGEFYNYARRNLNISNAITKPSHSAKIKSVTIVPRGVSDKDNQWLMQFKNGQNTFVLINSANVPVAINTENIPESDAPALPVAQEAAPTPLETPAASQAVTQDMTMSTSTAKKASLAAERIFELRQNRNDLISGQADNTPPDGHSMQLALDNLTAQEAALTAMFAGTEKKWTEVNTITYTPDSSGVTNFVIARISPTEGIVDPDDLSGEPVYLTVEPLTTGELPVDEKGSTKKFPKGGVAYQIPGTARVSISYNGSTIASQVVSLAQLGVTFGLDPKMFTDKNAPAYVIFDPATGAISTLAIKD